MGRLYYHMELETQGHWTNLSYLSCAHFISEQKMIESLSAHDLHPSDLVPSLMTTHTVLNPDYDPVEAKKQELERIAAEEEAEEAEAAAGEAAGEADADEGSQVLEVPASKLKPSGARTPGTVLQPNAPIAMPGVSTSLSVADKEVTLDIRWTILCDLFLLIVADSVYDARSRVLLERVAAHLGLGWLDVVRFERRVTEALEIQEGIERLQQQDVVEGHAKAAKRKRIVMMGLATIGASLTFD
jgi:hypothetical protein